MGPKRLVLYIYDNIHGMKAAMHASKVFSIEAASFRSIGRNKRRKSERKEQTPLLESIPSSLSDKHGSLISAAANATFQKGSEIRCGPHWPWPDGAAPQISIEAFAADIAVHHIKNIRQCLHIEP